MSDRSHWRSFCRPQLRVPPPLTATGDPIVPEPEKTFLQKYWHYIVIALIALSAFALLISRAHLSSYSASVIAPGGEEGPRGS